VTSAVLKVWSSLHWQQPSNVIGVIIQLATSGSFHRSKNMLGTMSEQDTC